MSDERGLVDVALPGGDRATLCGSHALMHARAGAPGGSPPDLQRLFAERRDGSDRRERGDELGEALTSAFSRERRAGERRRS